MYFTIICIIYYTQFSMLNAFVVGQFMLVVRKHLKSKNSFGFIKQFKIVIVVGMKEHSNSKIY